MVVLSRTSVVTYNVLGYVKTIAILLGHFIREENFVMSQALGVFVALVGVAMYTAFKLNGDQQQSTHKKTK
jgi:drug/metabolite transporter (DMT)-like permease